MQDFNSAIQEAELKGWLTTELAEASCTLDEWTEHLDSENVQGSLREELIQWGQDLIEGC